MAKGLGLKAKDKEKEVYFLPYALSLMPFAISLKPQAIRHKPV
jgi:hypothetical protein